MKNHFREKLHNPLLDLIMNLVTKMANGDREISKDQQNLAHAIQLIHIGNLVHQKGIHDLSKVPNYGNSLPADHDLILGNKIALLAGDFLLANAQMKITKMRHDEVLKIISRAMCDVVDSNFVGTHSKTDLPLPFKPGKIPKMTSASFEDSMKPVKLEGSSGSAEDEWMIRQMSSRGFLITKGCHATCVLAKQPVNFQKNCFELGKFFFLTCQAFDELEIYKTPIPLENFEVNLLSAPLLFHLNHEPLLYKTIVQQANSYDGIDHVTLFHKIVNGPGIDATEKLINKLKRETEKQLNSFSSSEAKSDFESILNKI